MKTLLKRKSLYMLAMTITIVLACNKQDEGPDGNPFATEINEYIRQLPGWINDNAGSSDSTFIQDVKINSEGIPYKCDIYEKNLIRTLQNIISVETNFGIIWPGALIQGNSLEGGELQPLSIDRAPITIQTDLPLNESYKVVDDPTSVSVQQAIADFQIAAGEMPEGSEAGAGLMNFVIEEAASFKQAMLSMGISGGFTEPQSQVGLEASANVSVERSFREHTVIAKFIQEMFTVRLADDLLPEPSDFFAPDVDFEDIQALEAKGEMDADNIPLYIESVTYGRIMLFTMKSTNVSSGAELSAAVNASMQDYVNGGASLTAEQKEILDNSTTTIFSAGGTKDAANEAIAELNWSKFFKAAPASTAIPISFVAKTLNGKKIVKIVDNAVYDQRSNCMDPYAYEFQVKLTDVRLESGTCLDCDYASSIAEDGAWLASPIQTGKITLGGGTYLVLGSGQYKATKEGGSISVRSGISGLWIKSTSSTFNFPFSDIEVDKTNQRDHVLTESGRSIRFKYDFVKIPKYK